MLGGKGEEREYNGLGEEKQRKRREGFFLRRVEGEDEYFHEQRQRINNVIHVSLRNIRRARFCLSSSPRRPSFPELWFSCKREPGIRVIHAGYLQ